mmetsp:Transcript_24696/g.40742  ORF Transcript_24696/g.40742 Transcript_24696/m.40742 type:complete len:119 (+) Transcript_24696:59-415(+)
MRSLLVILASFTALAEAFAPTSVHQSVTLSTSSRSSKLFFFGSSKNVPPADERTYPEAKQATYELMKGELGFGPENIVRPLLKQTQLEKRKLKVVYNAKKDGFDAQSFHSKVAGKEHQ